MKKSLLLGSAAALVAVSGAQAADLPVVEPVEYVRVCDAFGSGFHYIPGTETCLKFSGYVRAEIGIDGGDDFDEDADARTFMNSSFELVTNASSMTEIGMLVGQFAISGSNEGTVSVGDAWITIGENILVGRETSRFDFGGGYGMYDGLYTDEALNQFTFIMPFGNGVSATFGLEDTNTARRGTLLGAALVNVGPGTTTTTSVAISPTYGGMEIPEIVASLRISQGWGSAQISGAIHQIRTSYAAPTGLNILENESEEEFGFAIQAGAELNVGSMTKVKLVGAYADGAAAYTGGKATFADAMIAADGDIDTMDSWYVLAGLSHDFSDNLNFALTGSYHEFEDQAELWQIGSTVTYEVVENLLVRVGAKYEETDPDGAASTDEWQAKLRIQRNF